MVVFDKPHALADVPLHYCPGCTHGIVHRLVAEVMDELGIEDPNKKKKNSKKFSSMSFDDWFNDD